MPPGPQLQRRQGTARCVKYIADMVVVVKFNDSLTFARVVSEWAKRVRSKGDRTRRLNILWALLTTWLTSVSQQQLASHAPAVTSHVHEQSNLVQGLHERATEGIEANKSIQ